MLTKLNSLERLALALLVSLLVLSCALYLYQQSQPTQNQRPQLGGNFTLSSVNGPVSLSDFNGQAVVMMFGYASCPDVCPTGLANVGAALGRLTQAQQAQLQPLFISVDPDRDTPERLDQYSRYFYPTMIGLTGSKAEVDPVVAAYGGFYQKVPMPDSQMGYSVDHSSRIYLISRNGQLSQLLFHNSAVTELATALEKLLQE